jgi:hypothetical protein
MKNDHGSRVMAGKKRTQARDSPGYGCCRSVSG